MWEKIIQIIQGKELSLRERMLRTIILFGAIAVFVGIVECLVIAGTGSYWVLLLYLMLVIMAISFYASFKYRMYDLVAVLIGLILITMLFPVMFFLRGGLFGGGSVWFALGITYAFVMFRKRQLIFFLILSICSYGITYAIAINYPKLIHPMLSEESAYVDSLFSIILVGTIAGLTLKAHMRVFEEEHMLNIAQHKELENNFDAQNIFFANISHEIRTPINTIIGLNEMIMRTSSPAEISEYVGDIQIASKMLLNQVNDLLDLSQMELNRMKIIPVRYELTELISDLVDLTRVQIEKKNLEMYVDIDETLPSVLWGDEKRLKQILFNILDNAVKYTEEGSVTLFVQGEKIGGDEILLKVKIADTGIGIRKEDIEHLYDAFNRGDERKNARILGSGLGLAITKQLVDLMNGEITVDSIYTKGSVFTVKLKQRIIDFAPIGSTVIKQKSEREETAYKPSFEASKARILVVDDNRMNSSVVSKLLMATKVQVDVVNSGIQCLEMTKKKYYHVILMDYMMPGMNGVETMSALRKQENGLCRESAIIALTGNTMSGVREMCLEQGFDGYVEKPIRSKDLELEILQFIPTDLIESVENEDLLSENSGMIQKIIGRKRKKIYVTADCACDIPTELQEKYDIKLMYLYIKTKNGRFADTREIDSDSFADYISADSSSAYVQSGTVEEYEEFFAQTLTEAEEVIHISLASGTGPNYSNALAAAKCFDHVRVIDSEQISSGFGLLTLHAAKMAAEACNSDEICKSLEERKRHIQSVFILPGADIFYQNGRTKAVTMKACRQFLLHPMVAMRQKRAVIVALLAGSLENAWRQGIRWHLRKKKKISDEVVFITHVGCSVKQLEQIKEAVQRSIKFKRIIVQKASFTIACNSGIETIGISYYSI